MSLTIANMRPFAGRLAAAQNCFKPLIPRLLHSTPPRNRPIGVKLDGTDGLRQRQTGRRAMKLVITSKSMPPQKTGIWAAVGVFVFSFAIALIFGPLMMWGWPIAAQGLIELVFAGAMSAAAYQMVYRQEWTHEQKLIREHICTQCGYDLRASVGRCPECGRPIDLDSTSTRP